MSAFFAEQRGRPPVGTQQELIPDPRCYCNRDEILLLLARFGVWPHSSESLAATSVFAQPRLQSFRVLEGARLRFMIQQAPLSGNRCPRSHIQTKLFQYPTRKYEGLPTRATTAIGLAGACRNGPSHACKLVGLLARTRLE
jgi:hypothetical protein